jgi:hypothetical protein
MLTVLRYTEGNPMNSANSQTPATATTTASMRPPPAPGPHRLPAAGTPYRLGAGGGQHLWFLGNLVTWKATGEQTHGRLTIAEFVHPAGFAPPLHRHLHEAEIFYCPAQPSSAAKASSYVQRPATSSSCRPENPTPSS